MKLFLALAIFGILAFQSEGVIRKCLPLRLLSTNNPGPTSAPTTAGPATTAAPATTTVNATEYKRLQEQVSAANAQLNTQLGSTSLRIGNIVTQSIIIQNNKTVDNTTKGVVKTSTANLTQAATGTARRKRQTGFTIPETCEDAQTQALALTEQLKNALDLDLGSIISYLVFINSSINPFESQYESVLLMEQMITEAVNMLTVSSTYKETFASAVRACLAQVQSIQEQMCVTVPGQTSTLPVTISPVLGTSTCTYSQNAYFYKSDLTENPILAGHSLDGMPLYVGYLTLNTTKYPGGLTDYTSIAPGLYFTRKFGQLGMTVNNVTYLGYGANCDCYWLSNTASLNGAYVVNFNSGYDLFGVGRVTDSTTLTFSYNIVGRVDLVTGKMRYMDVWHQNEAVTTTYEQLVCKNGTPSTVPDTTTPSYATPEAGITAELSYIGTHISAKNAIETNISALITTTSNSALLYTQINVTLTEAQKTAISDMLNQLAGLAFTPSGLVDLSNCPESCVSCWALVEPITQVTALGLNIVRNIGNGVSDFEASLGHLQFQAVYAQQMIDTNTLNMILGTSKIFVQYIRNLIIELNFVYEGFERWRLHVIDLCGPQY